MKRSILTFAAASALVLAGVQTLAQAQTAPAATAATAPAAEGNTLTVKVRGMKAGKGKVVIMVFDSEQSYDASKSSNSNTFEATAAAGEVTFGGLTPGRYAVKAIYDVDGNNAYDPDVDVLGFSNHVTMSDPGHVPTFSEVSFALKPGSNTQQISFTH